MLLQEDGKAIKVTDAPTYFGPMGYRIEFHVSDGVIQASIFPPTRNRPPGQKIKLRFRHPEEKPISRVQLNGAPWQDFTHDTVIVPSEAGKPIAVTARYR